MTIQNQITARGERVGSAIGDGRKALDLFVAYFGRKLIRTITWEDLEEWKTESLEVPKVCGSERPFSFYPPQTRSFLSVNRELEVLRACFRFAVKKKPQPYLTSFTV